MGTAIAWTDETWNPVAGCSLVSPGCTSCYAMGVAHVRAGRMEKYQGLTEKVNGRAVWNGQVRLWPENLAQPLRWRRPRRIFVNSMSDLFHEGLSDNDILKVFAVMGQPAPGALERHTYQILTKRPERMLEFMRRLSWKFGTRSGGPWALPELPGRVLTPVPTLLGDGDPEPAPHIWIGVSAEDQGRADERIPLLLQTPAAVRFVSYEPALEAVDFDPYLHRWTGRKERPRLDWIIAGGESGPHARPCDLAWLLSARDQCAAAGVPFFMKQIGSRPYGPGGDGAEAERWPGHRSGANPREWHESWQVQQFPEPR